MDKKILGSKIAKNGFKNEDHIAEKFNLWEQDEEAKEWLIIMGYDLNAIEYVKAKVLKGGFKTDVNVRIQIKLKDVFDIQNIQVKLVSQKQGYNQVDKRWLKKYKEMWSMPEIVFNYLQYFTGEKEPYKKWTRNDQRMFISEFEDDKIEKIIDWFDKNKLIIITDIIKGRGEFHAEWVLVAQKLNQNSRWILKNVNEVIDFYFNKGLVKISKEGSINIGRVTIQRKGGDNGRKTASQLQFKLNPAELFELDE